MKELTMVIKSRTSPEIFIIRALTFSYMLVMFSLCYTCVTIFSQTYKLSYNVIILYNYILSFSFLTDFDRIQYLHCISSNKHLRYLFNFEAFGLLLESGA